MAPLSCTAPNDGSAGAFNSDENKATVWSVMGSGKMGLFAGVGSYLMGGEVRGA